MTRRDSVSYWLPGIGAALLMTLLVSSCATKSDFIELRREIATNSGITESRLNRIELSITAVDSLVREQMRLSQSLRANLGTQSREQHDNIDQIAARQEEINYQLRELLQKLQAIQLYGGVETQQPAEQQEPAASDQPATASVPTTPTVTPTNMPKVDPNQLYNAALDDVRNQRFQLAESRFLSFIMQFPKHELAGNAQYWLGEAVYGQGKFELAISEFEKVLKKYNKSPKVPAALLKIGFAQMELNRKKEATAMLNRLIKSYPNSEEADLARERLNAP